MSDNSYMTADICCHITVIRGLPSYNFYETSDVISEV